MVKWSCPEIVDTISLHFDVTVCVKVRASLDCKREESVS